MCGSTTHSVATAATAASAAVPPSRRTSIAAKVASGCEVAAMPFMAMTGERPGSWKSRLMANPKFIRSGGEMPADALDREVALRRAQGHGETGNDVDEADDHEDEEGAGGGRLHQQKLDQHREEKHQRQAVIDDGAYADARRLHHLAREQQDGERDEKIAGGHGPVGARDHVHAEQRAGPGDARHQEGDDVVDGEGDQQQRKAEQGHASFPPTGRADQASVFTFRTCRPLYMPVFRSMWCGRRSSPESLSSI